MNIISARNTVVTSTLLILCSLTIACGGGLVTPTQPQVSVQSTANALVAQFTIASPCAGQAMVQFGPDTTYARSTSWYPVSPMFSASRVLQQTIIPVAGMRASTTYHMRSQLQCASENFTSQDFTFTTQALPTIAFPSLAVNRPNPSPSSPENSGIEVVDIISAGTPAMFTDRDANPIWYYDIGKTNTLTLGKLMPNGDIILLASGSSGAFVREVDLEGNTIREIDLSAIQQKMQQSAYDFVPTNFHHDVLPLANGHIILLTSFTKAFTDLPGYPGTTQVQGDGLIDVDENNNPVWAWNSFDYLDVNRHLNGLPDWTHSNAIVYSATDGNLLLSMRHQSWVLKIDYNNGTGSGNLLWHLGYQGDFALSENNVPTDDPSQWFSFQHFPSIISQSGPQTSLTIWDNGDNRVLDSNGDICIPTGTPCFSRATVFEIDEGAMVANLLWADPLPYYGVWGGSINQLSNGNVEFDLNAPALPPSPDVASQVQEVTQTNPPQVVWQMNITPISSNAYRAYRVPSLYPGVTWAY